MTADESAIETTSTRFVYENRWMRVREDTIRRRDGSTGIYGVVEKSDFVVIVPVEDDGLSWTPKMGQLAKVEPCP